MPEAVEMNPNPQLAPVHPSAPAAVDHAAAARTARVDELAAAARNRRRSELAAPSALEIGAQAGEPTAALRAPTDARIAYDLHAVARTFTAFFAILAAALMHHGATTGDPHSVFFIAGLASLAISGGLLAFADRRLRDRVERLVAADRAGHGRAHETPSPK